MPIVNVNKDEGEFPCAGGASLQPRVTKGRVRNKDDKGHSLSDTQRQSLTIPAYSVDLVPSCVSTGSVLGGCQMEAGGRRCRQAVQTGMFSTTGAWQGLVTPGQ